MGKQTGTQSSASSAHAVSSRDDREVRDLEDVQGFLDRFARALTAGDGRAIAKMWDTPALVVGDRQLTAVSSPAEVERFFGGAREQYNDRGITDTRAEIAVLDSLTERIFNVTVRWPYLDARGNEKGEETSTYTLRRNDKGDLRLCVAIMHGASDS